MDVVVKLFPFIGRSFVKCGSNIWTQTSENGTKMAAPVKLDRLRSLMSQPKNRVNAYLVYSEDAHQSEYTPDRDKRRAFISNFTGSAGSVVVTDKEALLWTDGRYFLQASQQLTPEWTLMKDRLPETPSIPQWLAKNLPAKSRIGFDPKLVSKANIDSIGAELKSQKSDAELVPIQENLIDQIWGEVQPTYPNTPVFVHDMKYAGQSVEDKLEKIRGELSTNGAAAFVVTSLDEIAWLFNLRGNDIDFNPVFISYALVTPDNATLYIAQDKVKEDVRGALGSSVNYKSYDDVFEDIRSLSSQGKKIWLDSTRSCTALFDAAGEQALNRGSPITILKALKNEAELEGMRQAHIRDAVALISYFAWLEEELKGGNTGLSEAAAADKVDWFRSQQKDFVSLSFDTISSTGPSGAIIHYKPEHGSCATLKIEQMYLCDSGGQYKDGTTDVTRTMHFGEPTAREKRCFTRVLQGHIAIDKAIFPEGTNGYQLDILARLYLWKDGLDFRHGTGHGVGAFLNVHEGPHGISFRPTSQTVPLQGGMTVTNEPGYYEDGSFGIRIENVLLVREEKTPDNFGGKKYLGFENITFVPIQTKMLDAGIMSPEEVQWINEYHEEVLKRVGPHLEGKTLEWLKRETQPVRL
ncbi:hypothetical protein PROFUN_04368 [Planoprotostelium fungivorum]|uniref:Uncharacterized protein n=1 Tax=Planoprotostelium fungivorum TaxID=1890364 RepID=A0A2P6NHS2_9EUKA|nr:hypothetical protein PROFUN_04368 [Planoprotostelium fungivorum]